MNVLLGLFVYAALTFWYFYQTFGVHKVHSPEAGSLWLRVISAWLTLMLVMMEGDLQLADPTHEPDPPPAPW